MALDLDKINFKELISSGTTFEVTPSEENLDADDIVSTREYAEEVIKYANFNCVGDFEDDETYDSQDPFAVLESKMEDIFENGAIKKRVLRAGYGNKPEDRCIVRVHYNGYIEYKEEPFDSTFARKKPHTFVINSGAVIPGLDIAVQSMQINEKSQFLIKPQLAYGSFGCLERIPPDSPVLFEIELLEIIESAAADTYEHLPDDKKTDFNEVYKFCMAQCAKAKDLYHRNVTAAVKEYNIAASALENAQLENYENQVKQQELLYKIYSNLLVCYTKLQEPKKACVNFNKINHMSQGTAIKISAKVYFNNAKCLRMLGDYKMAKSRLQKAYELEPRNPEILNEFKIIDEEHNRYKEKERKLAEAFVTKSDQNK